MSELPPGFAESLARVVEPGRQAAVGEVISAATHLDDEGLQAFLEKFAARIRASPAPVRVDELQHFLRASKAGGFEGST